MVNRLECASTMNSLVYIGQRYRPFNLGAIFESDDFARECILELSITA